MTRLESETTTLKRPEKRGRDWLKRGVALATVALATASSARAMDIEEPHHPEPMQQVHVLRDSNGDPVKIGPEQTITLPSRGGGHGERYYQNHPVSKEVTRGETGYCQVVDVPLPKRFDYSEVVQGSKTEFALSFEDAQQLHSEIKSAETVDEAQQILSSALADMDIKAHFDAPVYVDGKATKSVADGPRSVFNYVDDLNRFVDTLAVVPKQMLGAAKSVNFVNADLLYRSEDVSPAGLYYANSREVVLATRSMDAGVVVHELAHGLHSKACQNYSDTELEREFDIALGYLSASPQTSELESRFNGGKRERGDQEAYDEYIRQGRQMGLPTQYSRENYIELMADLTSDIVLGEGYLAPSVMEASMEHDNARRLREMVVERMQKAMPGFDVEAYLAYMNTYDKIPPSAVDPSEVISRKISPLDGTYALFNGLELDGESKLSPAIAIKGHDDVPTQYIFAHHQVDNEGRSVEIDFNYTPGEVGDTVLQAGLDYLRDDPANKGMEIEVSYGMATSSQDRVVRLVATEPDE